MQRISAAYVLIRIGGVDLYRPKPRNTDLQELAGWIAPIATTIAAIMTAANLGTRVTGWGFAVFTVGSVAWCAVALGTSQSNLLWTNGFLTLVNVVGIWRWLGREARHEDGRAIAAERSSAARVPTLFGIGSLSGASLTGREGVVLGTVVDGMMRCEGWGLTYLVVAEGGLAGVGERLHALAPELIRHCEDGIACDLNATELANLPVLKAGDWPVTLDERDTHAAV